MDAVFPQWIEYNDQKWTIEAVSNGCSGRLLPDEFDVITVEHIHDSRNVPGYIAIYGIDKNCLTLRELNFTRTSKQHEYYNLPASLDFAGGLLIGNCPESDLYPPPWPIAHGRFTSIVELGFEEGVVTQTIDQTDKIASIVSRENDPDTPFNRLVAAANQTRDDLPHFHYRYNPGSHYPRP